MRRRSLIAAAIAGAVPALPGVAGAQVPSQDAVVLAAVTCLAVEGSEAGAPSRGAAGVGVRARNVDIVRSGYEAWNRGDLDEIGRMTDDSFEWSEAAEVPGAGTRRGRAEFDHYLRSFSRFWRQFEFEPIEIRDLGDRVLAVVIERGRSVHDDVEVSQRFVHLWTLRNGKAVRLEGFYDKAAALEAAGVRE
jgi:ketosteroid isomerase-like protein